MPRKKTVKKRSIPKKIETLERGMREFQKGADSFLKSSEKYKNLDEELSKLKEKREQLSAEKKTTLKTLEIYKYGNIVLSVPFKGVYIFLDPAKDKKESIKTMRIVYPKSKITVVERTSKNVEKVYGSVMKKFDALIKEKEKQKEKTFEKIAG